MEQSWILLMINGSDLLAFEIKAGAAPKLTKGFHTAREDVQPTKIFVVSRTDETWTTGDGIIHTSLNELPQQLAGFSTIE